MTSDQRLRLAVFIDFDNIEIGVKNTLNNTFDVGVVLEALRERGDVVSKTAYGDWTYYIAPFAESAYEARVITATEDAAETALSGALGVDPLLLTAIRDLPALDQQLLALVALEGYPLADAAIALNMSTQAARSRWQRIRRRQRRVQYRAWDQVRYRDLRRGDDRCSRQRHRGACGQ